MRAGENLLWALYILGGYSLGGVLFARLAPRLVRHVDICGVSGDGNPGVFNVFTHCGKPLGILCLALELGKGFLPVWSAGRVLPAEKLLFAAVLAAPVLGHATAPFDRDIRGGKGIAVSFGALLGLLPECLAVFALAALYISFSTFLRVRSHRRRSILTFALFGVGSAATLGWLGRLSLAVGCAALAAIVLLRHVRSERDIPEKARAAV